MRLLQRITSFTKFYFFAFAVSVLSRDEKDPKVILSKLRELNLDYSGCPTVASPDGFNIDDVGGFWYDYLSTETFDANCWCTATTTAVNEDLGQLDSIVQCSLHEVNGTQMKYHLWLQQNITAFGNPSEFIVYNSSFNRAFVGSKVNYFWIASGRAYAFYSCYPESAASVDVQFNSQATNIYEIHVIYDPQNDLTSTDINDVYDLISKYNLNPLNKSLKIEPHPSSCTYTYN